MKKLTIFALLVGLMLCSKLLFATVDNVNPVVKGSSVPLPMIREVALATQQQLQEFSLIHGLEKAVTTAPEVQKYSFPVADDFLTMDETTAVAPPPEADDLSDILYDLGNGNNCLGEIRDGKLAIKEALKLGNIIETLTGGDLVELPLVIKEDIGNLKAVIVFNSIKLGTTGAELEVFVSMKIPQKSRDKQNRKAETELFFKGEQIRLSKDGGIQEGYLVLGCDYAFELGGSQQKAAVVLKKGYLKSEAPSGYPLDSPENQLSEEYVGTFLKLGCGGILEFGLAAELHFSREWLIPVDADGEDIKNKEEGGKIIKQRIKVNFGLRIQDWNNLLVENINIPRFRLAKNDKEELKVFFEVANANIDLSDYRNPGNVKFPNGYLSDLPNKNLWRGVYISNVEITLPKPFKKSCGGITENVIPNENKYNTISTADFASELSLSGPNVPVVPVVYQEKLPLAITTDESCPITVGANDLLIDKKGVSGEIYVTNIISLAGGSGAGGGTDSNGKPRGKWRWSVDKLGIILNQSELQGFSFGGKIVIPVADKKNPFVYDGKISFEESDPTYKLTVQIEENPANPNVLSFPLFNALKVKLKGGTKLDVVYQDGSFQPKATLYGSMTVGRSKDENGLTIADKVNLPSVDFEKLIVSTEAPYVYLGDGGFVSLSAGGGEMMKFAISVGDFAFGSGKREDPETGEDEYFSSLKFNVGINLSSAKAGITGKGSLEVFGKLETDLIGVHEWKFDRLRFNGAEVVINIGPVNGRGKLNLYEDDPIYGNGFSAALDAKISITEGKSFDIKLAAVFGRTPDFRYFMVDGYVDGLDILIAGPVSLKGFGGGGFRHMIPGGFDPRVKQNPALNNLATDVSGLTYVPSQRTSFGFKFAVGIGIAGRFDQIDGKLTGIMQFGPNLSLRNITFLGAVTILTNTNNNSQQTQEFCKKKSLQQQVEGIGGNEEELNRQARRCLDNEPSQNSINALLGINVDYDNNKFHGFAEVKIKAARGSIEGIGYLDLLLDPEKEQWHLYIGGYHDPKVLVDEFGFVEDTNDPDYGEENYGKVELTPLNVTLKYDAFTARADSYIMMGNDIPGPPRLHPAAQSFFGDEQLSNNRGDVLNCGGRSANNATGLVLGAAAIIKFKKQKKKKRKLTLFDVEISGGVGLDIALLSYDESISCSNSEPGELSPEEKESHGVNQFRATGNIWSYLLAKVKMFGASLPNIGAGIKLSADMPNPAYFEALAVIDWKKRLKFKFNIGKKCGVPCQTIEP